MMYSPLTKWGRMPLYDYVCVCGREEEKFLSFASSQKVMLCSCGAVLEKKISLPGVPNFGFKPFITEHITGYPVKVISRQHKVELLKKHSLVEAG